jgi:hypothetical protein
LRPILRGAVIQEFFPRHYVVAAGEYRWEALFFTYLSLDGAVGRLDRTRATDRVATLKNDTFTSLGAKLRQRLFV